VNLQRLLMIKNSRGQNVIEYTVLIATILSALLIMHIYIKRAYQGRIKAEADSVSQQYAPGHTSSLISSNSNTNTVTRVGIDGVEQGSTVTTSRSRSFYDRREKISPFAQD
jgi:uncharacterized protein (UPF0333 family)